MACCIVEDGWSLRRAAERFHVAVTTAARWSRRYAHWDQPAWPTAAHDPTTAPTRLPRTRSDASSKSAWCAAGYPARIAHLHGLNVSTVHNVLRGDKLLKRWLDRPTGRVIRRMESAAPGDLVHLDVKKLEKIPAGGGWRKLGRTRRQPQLTSRQEFRTTS